MAPRDTWSGWWRQDELREADGEHGQWFRDHSDYVVQALEETAAAALLVALDL